MDAPTIDEVCAVAFGKSIYPYQKQIIEAAFRHRKITIRATTRAGKSYCMAMVAILRAVVLPNHRVGIIAPTHDKTRIIMNYIADLLASNAMFDSWAMVSTEGLTKLERLRKEVSKKRITGTNGSSIECLSVDLDARGFGVMGRAFDCLPAGAVILTDKGKIKVEDMVRERLRCRVLSRGKNGKLERVADFHEAGVFYGFKQHPEYFDVRFVVYHVGFVHYHARRAPAHHSEPPAVQVHAQALDFGAVRARDALLAHLFSQALELCQPLRAHHRPVVEHRVACEQVGDVVHDDARLVVRRGYN